MTSEQYLVRIEASMKIDLDLYTEQVCELVGVSKLPIEEAILRGGRWTHD
jgi:hypothetical protein